MPVRFLSCAGPAALVRAGTVPAQGAKSKTQRGKAEEKTAMAKSGVGAAALPLPRSGGSLHFVVKNRPTTIYGGAKNYRKIF